MVAVDVVLRRVVDDLVRVPTAGQVEALVPEPEGGASDRMRDRRPARVERIETGSYTQTCGCALVTWPVL